MNKPIVTIVISPREGHVLSERSLLSVLADDAVPFELIYVDIASPPKIEQAIRAHGEARDFRVLRHDCWIAPALARKRALSEVKTKYVAFVDNDILVQPGCLEKLISCAEETGAGLVCPLYVQAGGGKAPTIHMAGGVFTWSEEAGGELIGEHHRLVGAPLEAAETLRRAKADYAEYHYVLGETAFLNSPGVISDDILLIHEHLDLALVARERGLDIIVEPSARATYLAFDPRPLSDVAFYRQRWNADACRDSVLAFKRKWLGVNTIAFVESTFDYISARLHEVELRRRGSAGTDLTEPMTRAELAQNRCELREQATSRGYSKNEIRTMESAADFATLLFEGLYRPDGRPFLNHVIGVASALVRYELNIGIVLAGLLHSTFTHRPAWMTDSELSAALAGAPEVTKLVRGQPSVRAFLAQDDVDLMSLNTVGAGIAALLAANETDMRLSGEYRATGRPPEIKSAGLDRIGVALSLFNVDGLARSACITSGEGNAWPLLNAGVRHSSFRLDAKNRRLLPV